MDEDTVVWMNLWRIRVWCESLGWLDSRNFFCSQFRVEFGDRFSKISSDGVQEIPSDIEAARYHNSGRKSTPASDSPLTIIHKSSKIVSVGLMCVWFDSVMMQGQKTEVVQCCYDDHIMVGHELYKPSSKIAPNCMWLDLLLNPAWHKVHTNNEIWGTL